MSITIVVCSLIQKYRHSGAIKPKKKLLDGLYSAERHHSFEFLEHVPAAIVALTGQKVLSLLLYTNYMTDTQQKLMYARIMLEQAKQNTNDYSVFIANLDAFVTDARSVTAYAKGI